MKKLTTAIGFLMIIAFGGCTSRQVTTILEDVESYIMERPDSALAVLDTMDRTLLSNDRLKAHHALLHAMALDKNFIDVTDDSLASVALSYYSRKGPEKYEARAMYYLGLSYYYAGDYNKAILEFTKAEKIAERSDSLYWGFVKVAQADTYAKTYNFSEGVNCLRKAIYIYESINAKYYLSVAELRLSQTLLNENNKEGVPILYKLINSEDVDAKVKLNAILSYAYMNVVAETPDYKISDEYFTRIYKEYAGQYMSHKDYWAYAYAQYMLGKYKESSSMVAQLSEIDSSATADYWQYRINKEQDNTLIALQFLEQSLTKNNTEVTEALKQSLALTQKKYYESQFRESSLQIRVKNQMFIIVIVISVLMIIVSVLGLQKYISRQKKEKEKLLEYAEEINRQLCQYKDENYPTLKKRFISLYKSRFETIGTLCGQYLQDKNREDIEKVMFHRVMLLIDDIRNDNVRKAKFESLLDAELDGIMTRFRNEIPKCKEWEVTMFGYLVAGFDSTTISRLMDLSLDQVYSYKRRLIQKIENKKPEHSAQFLEMLN